MVDNTIALQVRPLDVSAPLMRAQQMRQMQAETQKTETDMRNLAIGQEARGLVPYVNHPEFGQRWAQSVDRLTSQGLLDPQTAQQWRSSPSPFLLKQIIAQTSTPEMQFRMQESERSQANTDRSFDLQKQQIQATIEGSKAPPGFQRTATGLQPVVGGPADPDYLERAHKAKEKPRQMSVTDISKMSDEGGKLANLTSFIANFKPEFSGSVVKPLGEARNWVGRNLPEWAVDPAAAQGASWWQQYDRYKNVVRNELFGSALTVNEQAAFERADVNPGMSPKQVETNLAKQKEIAEVGIKRKANALITAGYDPKTIAAAYGVDLKQLGVAEKRGAAASPATSTWTDPETNKTYTVRDGKLFAQ